MRGVGSDSCSSAEVEYQIVGMADRNVTFWRGQRPSAPEMRCGSSASGRLCLVPNRPWELRQVDPQFRAQVFTVGILGSGFCEGVCVPNMARSFKQLSKSQHRSML